LHSAVWLNAQSLFILPRPVTPKTPLVAYCVGRFLNDFTAVEDAVTVEPVGNFTLKGIGRPMAAYKVLSAVSSKN
jgi:hypothetical protein